MNPPSQAKGISVWFGVGKHVEGDEADSTPHLAEQPAEPQTGTPQTRNPAALDPVEQAALERAKTAWERFVWSEPDGLVVGRSVEEVAAKLAMQEAEADSTDHDATG